MPITPPTPPPPRGHVEVVIDALYGPYPLPFVVLARNVPELDAPELDAALTYLRAEGRVRVAGLGAGCAEVYEVVEGRADA